ncbi:MAG TPA: hypothetical protein VF486_06670 [Actinomycetes bacterium]
MRTKLRTKVVAALVALAAGALLALFASSGPAVAFFSGGLFLDVQVESPARLVARGAAVDVPVEVTCNATGSAFVQVSVTQKAGSGVAQGFGSTEVGCTGSGQQVTVRVQASGGKTFKQGTAVASAEVFGCRPGVCGNETDSETISVQK